MNVKELIEQLHKYDMEAEVMIFSKHDQQFVDIMKIDLYESISDSVNTVGIIGDAPF